MATIALNYYCDLNQAVKVRYIDGNVFSGDNAGNTISVFVMDGDQPATIGGSVSADVIRADGSTVAVSGALDGNRAYVILPQACYAVPGSISIVIKNTQNTTVTTIAALVGIVYRSSTDTVVDPGTIIPSISSLIAAIDAAVGSIPADYSALLASIAANYSPSKTYPVGAYCWETGVLKRCIVPIAAAETYTAAHWTDAVIGDDLSALKSAIGVEQSTISTTEVSPYSGYWGRNVTTGIVSLSAPGDTYRTLEHPIDISALSPGVKVSVLASVNSSYGAFITDANYNSLDYVNGTNASSKGYTTGSTPQVVTFIIPKNAKYIIADIRSSYYTGLSDFTVSVYDDSIIDLKTRMTDAETEIVSIDIRVDKIENEVGGGAITITPSLSTRKDGYYGRNVTTNKLGYYESTTYYTVELVDISKLVAGTQVKMMASVNSTYGIFITDDGLNVLDYVDGNNAELKGYTTGSTPQLVTLTVPQNAKYITSDIRNAYYSSMSDFDVNGIQKDNITLLQEDVIGLAINGNVLSGKKWVACGDSFTAGAFTNSLTDNYTFESGLYAGNYKVYPFWIGRRNPFMEVVNEAISGSTMAAGTSGVNPFSGTRYTNIPADADYITLEFGINDSGNDIPIGTIDDETNETFYGAWNVVLSYFQEHFPFAHIGIIVGPGMQTSNGQQYANAEIAVAKKWGVPYLNIQFESGGGKIPLMLRTNNPDVSAAAKSACNQRQYVNPSESTPNHHPNEKAHEFESTFIEAWLRTL